MRNFPWVRLDTNLPQHDKIIALAEHGDRGLAAAFVYVSSLAYSGAYGTDGHITRATLKFIHGKLSHAKLLVSHQLWDETDRGWVVRNYGNRQAVGATQQAISDALSAAGTRGAQARWGGTTRKTGTWEDPEANGLAIMAEPMATPDANRNATVRNDTKREPRHTETSSRPSRARVDELKSQRELTRNRRTGDATA